MISALMITKWDCVNENVGTGNQFMVYRMYRWVDMIHVDEAVKQFVFRVYLVYYVDLKAAWHPRLLTGALGGLGSAGHGHGPPWRALRALLLPFVRLLARRAFWISRIMRRRERRYGGACRLGSFPPW